MARYTGPKFKIDRREGANLFLKGRRSSSSKHPIEKKGAVPPGQHGQRSLRKRTSDYGMQLREKQKLKRMYGILEKQFRRHFSEAAKEKGNTGEALMRILESRLDNVVYRLGFAPSRLSARQLINHGHVKVNEKKVDIPSYNTKVGESISLKEKAQKFQVVEEGISLRGDETPDWLQKKGLVGKVSKMPTDDDFELSVDSQLIIEYYSR